MIWVIYRKVASLSLPDNQEIFFLSITGIFYNLGGMEGISMSLVNQIGLESVHWARSYLSQQSWLEKGDNMAVIFEAIKDF